jgi:hypothetical protein
MMFAWSFAARTIEEVARLVRALSKHRYVSEVDHRIHFSVDCALSSCPLFAPHASAFERRRAATDLDPGSRDPTLWRPATLDEIVAALGAFWTPGEEAVRHRARLNEVLASIGGGPATHPPFRAPADDPPHPELVLLDWVLLPVDELDTERHAGALAAMAEAEEEVNASAPIYQEGPTLSSAELCEGAPLGVLAEDFMVWSEPPYSYANYVFRGAAKAAKLVDPPVGYHDL